VLSWCWDHHCQSAEVSGILSPPGELVGMHPVCLHLGKLNWPCACPWSVVRFEPEWGRCLAFPSCLNHVRLYCHPVVLTS
jgi:hypothetical protein